MFSTAVLPVSFDASVVRLGEMLRFLAYFDATRVVFVHVTSQTVDDPLQVRMNGLMAEVVKELEAKTVQGDPNARAAKDIALQQEIRRGSPDQEIVAAARENRADFIYFPWKRKSWLRHTLVGSTTQAVIRISPVPVFVFKGSWDWDRDVPFRVVYPSNFGDSDKAVIPFLQHRGLQADELTIMHVSRHSSDSAADKEDTYACNVNLARIAGEVKSNFKNIVQRRATGDRRKKILSVVRKNRAALLVLGHDGEGSVATSLASYAPCSVLVVGASQNE